MADLENWIHHQLDLRQPAERGDSVKPGVERSGTPGPDFSWQRGYGAFTVSQSHVEQVGRYIRRLKEHQKISFRTEFIQFLKANGIEYDERYV